MMQGKAENSMSRHDGIIVKNIINQSESDLFFAKRCKKYYTGMMMAIYYVVLCFIGFLGYWKLLARRFISLFQYLIFIRYISVFLCSFGISDQARQLSANSLSNLHIFCGNIRQER